MQRRRKGPRPGRPRRRPRGEPPLRELLAREHCFGNHLDQDPGLAGVPAGRAPRGRGPGIAPLVHPRGHRRSQDRSRRVVRVHHRGARSFRNAGRELHPPRRPNPDQGDRRIHRELRGANRTDRVLAHDPGDRRGLGRVERIRREAGLLRRQEQECLAMDRAMLDRAEVRQLFLEYRGASEGDRARLREQLVDQYIGLVEFLARRFRNRGEPLEDLVQVGTIGLLKAIDRFDLDREVEFSTYATPTIVGELKRHFRDKGWAVRVPRRLQELHLQLSKVMSALSQELGRSPTVSEISDVTGKSEEEVLEGLEISQAYNFTSLDAPIDSGDSSSTSFAEHLGKQDEHLENLEYRASLAPEMEKLPEREREILYLRFFKGLTQSEIADRMRISQMHVSRLLSRTLAQLRHALEDQ